MSNKGYSSTSINRKLSSLRSFYNYLVKTNEIEHNYYDGFIVTGAPVEKLKYEDVDYWTRLTEIFDWARTHATSTLYICWAA